jgi:aldose 1-epimerase
MGVTRRAWGELADGTAIERFELTSGTVSLGLLTYGASAHTLLAPDRDGVPADILLGFHDLESYAAEQPFLGATVGRYANRIAGGRFAIDGTTYTVPANDGPHALHGGPDGYFRRVWDVEEHASLPDGGLVGLRLLDPAGTMGFPGELDVRLRVSVEGAIVRWDITATTTEPTVVNLTNHAYFALSPGDTVLGHVVRIPASAYLPVDGTGIPLPTAPAPVQDGPFDLRHPTLLSKRVGTSVPGGYDHCFVVDGAGLRVAAQVIDPLTGRTLTVHTTEPGVQLYTGNFLDGTLSGRTGPLVRHAGLCLETEAFPDAPNRPDFPSTLLVPGRTYATTTVWELGVVS